MSTPLPSEPQVPKTSPKAIAALVLSLRSDRRFARRLVAVTVVFAIAGLVAGMLAPKWYRSVVTLVPAAQPRGAGVSGLLGAELGGLGSGLASSMGLGADATRIVAVLQSNAVSDAAVQKFELMKRYEVKYLESAREALWRHCEVKSLPKPNLVQLSCEDTDPRFAQNLLAFLADYGNQVFRRVSKTSASEEVRFLEARAIELRHQADDVAARMREFQERHQVVDLEWQARSVVSAMAALDAQRIAKQIELDYARMFSSPEEAATRQLESQLSVVEKKMLDLEEHRASDRSVRGQSGTGRDRGAGVFPAALAVPGLRAEYEKLFRDRKVAEATLVYVMERLEGARASEARDVSTFQVLDPPTLPSRKSRPSRLLILVGAVTAGSLTAVLAEVVRKSRPSFLQRFLGEEATGGSARVP
jgi:capsule polysaccharide export protein KpsE/RkpR